VSFGTKEIIPLVAVGKLWYSPTTEHDLSYAHSEWRRSLDAKQCEKEAIGVANKLRKELTGISTRCAAVAAASASLGALKRPRKWIADTGSPYDLVCVNDLHEQLLAARVPADNVVELNTCNGTAEANEQVRISTPSLGDELKALILNSTPPVMTIGKRVMEQGYGFMWQAYLAPVLYTPAGKQIQLEVINNVPHDVAPVGRALGEETAMKIELESLPGHMVKGLELIESSITPHCIKPLSDGVLPDHKGDGAVDLLHDDVALTVQERSEDGRLVPSLPGVIDDVEVPLNELVAIFSPSNCNAEQSLQMITFVAKRWLPQVWLC
jgi:hypothetical protein